MTVKKKSAVKKARKKARKKTVREKKEYELAVLRMQSSDQIAPKNKKKSRKVKAPTGTCFVLMPFKEPFETYYRSIIKPAIGSANLAVKRGDSMFTPTPIMGDVWEMIQQANVLVAELTEKNANVFYELGLAHAIGKPVVLISETLDDVPFDLQQLRVILYDKDDPAWGNKLKTSLTTALQETLSSPVVAVPPMFRKKVKSQAPEDSETSLRLLALERRMRSLDSGRALSLRKKKGPVDWGEVEEYLTRFPTSKDLSTKEFRRRAEAVAWTVAQLRAGVPTAVVRKALTAALSADEAILVLDLAHTHEQIT